MPNYKGLAVGAFGGSDIWQETDGSSALTITSVADMTAANILGVVITSTSAITAGYTQGVYVNMRLDGGITGGATIQANAFAADITIDSTFSADVTGAYYYFAEGASGSTPTSGRATGVVSWFAAYGASMLERVGFIAGSEETSSNQATFLDSAFSATSGAAGAWGSLLACRGGPPSYLLHFTAAPGEEEMYSTGVRGNVAAASAWLKVNVAGTVHWIALHASCTS